MSSRVPWKQLVLVPAILSLLVSMVRLAGELWQGSELLFNRAAGGPGALIGITWLVPIFGFYFGWSLVSRGLASVSPWRTAGASLAGLAILVLIMASVATFFEPGLPPTLWFVNLASILAILATRRGWPELWTTLFAYGLAARIPVVVIMFFAIQGDWGTHYDVVPVPEFPEMSVLAKFFLIGLLPQLTTWIAFTLVVGGLCGALGQALALGAQRRLEGSKGAQYPDP